MKPVGMALKAAFLLLAFALVAPPGGWAQSEEQQSLGDLARKQKAKKGQSEEKEKKVLTNEDLPPGSEPSSSPAASSSASAEGQPAGDAPSEATEKEAAAEGEGDQAEMTKAQQADEARKKAEALKHDEAATQKGIQRYEEMLANETDPSRRELYQRALRNAQGNLGTVQRQRAEAEKEAAAKEAAAQQEQPAPPPQ